MADIYGNGLALDEQVLGLLWGRQNVTVNNIANVDTPNFKSQYITFENELAKRLSTASYGTKSRNRIADVIHTQNAAVHITDNETTRLDGNNVDMDQEQVDLVKTAYEYEYLIKSVSNEFKRLSAAVKSF